MVTGVKRVGGEGLNIYTYSAYNFFFFAALGLHCQRAGYQSQARGLPLVAEGSLVAPQHVGTWFPDQRLNLHRLHWKVDS